MGQLISLYSFNRGIVSRLGLGRADIRRIALSAEIQRNWMSRVLGSMTLRPGFGYLGATLSNNAAKYIGFIFSTTDTALLELTSGAMRVWIDDALISRPSITSTITNGTFDTDLTGWTDNDEVGGVSQWVSPGYMGLSGNGTAAAIRDQTITVSGANVGVEHALRIVIARGPVMLRVGSSVGGDDYITETTLQTGTHSLALTPTGNFNIRFFSRRIPVVWVNSCELESSGVVQITTPWTSADLNNIRYDQSADVVFVACSGYQQRRIERRATRSWSVALYVTEDGPFRLENVSTTTLTASALTGNITVTASTSLFKSTHVGALFSLSSVGQFVQANITAQNTFTSAIRVIGVGTSRAFTIVISGAFTATVTLQRSLDSDTGPWSDVGGSTWTAPITTSFNDALDNQIAYYRIGVKTGDYTSGTVGVQLSIGSGSIRGIVRITGFTSATSVEAEVLSDLGSTAATDVWQEGEWSDFRGWPTAVALHEGRLFWAGRKIFGSISDAFDSFDEEIDGDSGTINRSIGSGPVDTINFMLSLQRLIVGSQGAEFTVRSSSLDEPLTPTNFNIKATSNQGSAAVEAIKIDQRGLFVQRNSIKVFELSIGNQSYDYQAVDITALAPDIGSPSIARIAAQRQPDTRIHCVRSDGILLSLIYDVNENVSAWIEIETDGTIEDVVTLPAESGDTDDRLYCVIKRTINGSTVRYLEKMAQEGECRGDLQLCKLADSFVIYSGVSTKYITGLSHLEGESVIVWADGEDVGTVDTSATWTQRYTVSGGAITLETAASNVVVGLSYTAPFKSVKLGLATQQTQSPLNRHKNIKELGLILADTHARGLRFGADFDHLDDMPGIESGATVSGVREDYDEEPIQFPGTWTTDSRLCLQAQAPRPCTVIAATIDMETN